MKIDIRDFFENYEDTEIDLQPDPDFDAEKIIRMTRRELKRRRVYLAATGFAAVAALVAILFATGFGMTKISTSDTPWNAGSSDGEVNVVYEWIGDFLNSLRFKKVNYGEQDPIPGMSDWDDGKQGMILEYETESETERESEDATEGEREPESTTEEETEGVTETETESKAPAYQEGPEVGETITITAVQIGYTPGSSGGDGYDTSVTLRSRLAVLGYSAEEISAAWSEKELTDAYTYVTKERKPSLDYMIQVIQPYEVESRTFSFHGETEIVKNGMIGEWEATWLTVDQNKQDQEKEAEYESMSEEQKDWWEQVDNHLLLYHPTKHYLINLSVNSRHYDMAELEKMAAEIVVVEAEMSVTTQINQVVQYPGQTFNLNAVLG